MLSKQSNEAIFTITRELSIKTNMGPSTPSIKTPATPLPSSLPSFPRSPYPSDGVKTPITPPSAYADFLRSAASLTPITPTARTPWSASSTSSSASSSSSGDLKSPRFPSAGYYLIHTPPVTSLPGEPPVPSTPGGVLRVRVMTEEKGVALMPAPKGKRRRLE
ncbi:hypothetical protein BJ508DRAFT_411972 [Ascobolus immersus RN42]|uniref:Uncharacterized protein n=1 Tax=Ascobolus immersus RN42 TaxID=1160509 RepID=A0A3N4IHG3_ASCIM|nr:hypothetical protein BJ508DRAFT_411972 [Ascobolus immersus RN42]